MADEQLTNKIEAWLQGKLPAAEASAFQAEVAADPALAEEVELHRLTLRAMEHLSEQHLQQNVLMWMEGVNMDDLEDVEKKPGPLKISSPTRNWFRSAAALLFLAGAFVFYQIWKSGAEKQRIAALEAEVKQQDSLLFELKQLPVVDLTKIDSLYRQNEQLRQQLQDAIKGTTKSKEIKPTAPIAYYLRPEDLGSTLNRGNDSSVKQYLKEGVARFEQSNMKQAESKARDVLKINPENRDAMRLLAHALFGQQRFWEAETEFARMQKEYPEKSDEAYEAQWNRVLCFRALSAANARQQALYIASLDSILNEPNHLYRVLAKQMKEADRKNNLK